MTLKKKEINHQFYYSIILKTYEKNILFYNFFMTFSCSRYKNWWLFFFFLKSTNFYILNMKKKKKKITTIDYFLMFQTYILMTF